MKKVKVLFLVITVLVTLVIAGCGVVVDVPITPATGTIRICSSSFNVYGTLYVDNANYGIIDGAGDIGSTCLPVGPLVLGRSYHVQIIDENYGSGYYVSRYITPSYDGQYFYIP